MQAQPQLPPNGAAISFYRQPLVLTVAPAVASVSDAPLTVRVEVAADDQFEHIAQTKEAKQAGNAATRVTLEPLPESTTWFWRARTLTSHGSGDCGRRAAPHV